MPDTIYLLTVLAVYLTVVQASIDCYVCDTALANNEDKQVCDDTFTLSRGATIESGCAACVKEKTIHSGVMFIKRSCDKTLRWESSIWTCNTREREYVFGFPGTKCQCLNNLCNDSTLPTFGFVTLFIPSLYLALS